MATYFNILAWKTSWTEEPSGYSPWGHEGLNMTEHTFLFLITILKVIKENMLILN